MNIEHRALVLRNTDPERRCYDGWHYKAEWQWTNWEVLEEGIPEERIESRLDFWRSLNAYAVSERGKSATKEYRKV